MSEPVDIKKLWRNVVDTMYDHMADEESDWFEEHVELPVRALMCQMEGHKVVDDQCGRPDHRYCLVCGVRQPHAEVNV